MGLRIAVGIVEFWLKHGHLNEGRDRLSRLLSEVGEEEDAELRAKALSEVGWLARHQGDSAAARRLYEESLALYRALGDKEGIADQLALLALESDPEAARPLWEESLTLYREVGDKQGIAHVLLYIDRSEDEASIRQRFAESLAVIREIEHIYERGHLLRGLAICNGQFLQDYDAARQLLEECMAIERQFGNIRGLAETCNQIGCLEWIQTNYTAARPALEESLVLYHKLGEKSTIIWPLERIANVTAEEGKTEWAATVWAVVERLREDLGIPRSMWPGFQEAYEGWVAAARQASDPEAFAQAWARGRAMTLDQAIAFALCRPAGCTLTP